MSILQVTFSVNASRMPSTISPVVDVIGPQGPIQANIRSTDHGQYKVSWAPLHAGGCIHFSFGGISLLLLW